jgi:hypothetical protein
MTPVAVLFLVLSIALVWGGLVVSSVLLARSSRAQSADPVEPELPGKEL